jgi:O-acetyl-ADP-ribose deacetylase (regulator of RNase III)
LKGERALRIRSEAMVEEVMVKQVKISLIQGDITRQNTEAIVNAANPGLMGGGGVDGAIHRAGGPAILEECKQIVARQGRLPTGKAVITTGGNLKARFVIHTVGPVWHGGNQGEADLLASAYRESLKLADDKRLNSVSFPSISTGVYGYPVDEGARVALSSVMAAAQGLSSVREIIFVLFDSGTYSSYSRALKELTAAK